VKRRRLLLTVFLVLGAVALALQVIPASTFVSAQSYPPPEDFTVINGTNPRLEELSRVLGIPMAELEGMSTKEVRQLYVTNAEKLGIVVYENTWDWLGHEIPRIIAGTKVRKTESFNDIQD